MNYGYDSRCDGWQPARVADLIVALRDTIHEAPELQATQGSGPYVEVGGLYEGIRVRSLTHVPDLEAACRTLDAVYDRVMVVAP